MSYTPPPLPPLPQSPGDARVTYVTTTAATSCTSLNGGAATYIVGVYNVSSTAQTSGVTIYDNASAASGQVALALGPLGINQIVTLPAPGIRLANGCTALAGGTPVAPGIGILTR